MTAPASFQIEVRDPKTGKPVKLKLDRLGEDKALVTFTRDHSPQTYKLVEIRRTEFGIECKVDTWGSPEMSCLRAAGRKARRTAQHNQDAARRPV